MFVIEGYLVDRYMSFKLDFFVDDLILENKCFKE